MHKKIQENIQNAIQQSKLSLLNEYLLKIPVFAEFKENFQQFSETKRYNVSNNRRTSSNRLAFNIETIQQNLPNQKAVEKQTFSNDELQQQENQYSQQNCYESSAYYQFLKKIRVINLFNQPYELKNQCLYTFFGKGTLVSKQLFFDYGSNTLNRGNTPVSPFASNLLSNNSGISKILTVNSEYKRLSGGLFSKASSKKLLRSDSNSSKQLETHSNGIDQNNRGKLLQFCLGDIKIKKKGFASLFTQEDPIKVKRQVRQSEIRTNLRKGTTGKGKHKTINNQVCKQSFQLRSFEVIDQNSFYMPQMSNNTFSGSRIVSNVFGITPFSLVIPSVDQACMLLQIPSQQVNESLMNFLREKYNEKIKFLMGFNVFNDISKAKIQAESHNFKFSKYKFNQTLYTNVKQGRTILQKDANQTHHSTEIQKMIRDVLFSTLQNPAGQTEKVIYFIQKGQVEITIDYSLGSTAKKTSYIVKGPSIIFSDGYVSNNFTNKQIIESYQKIETAKCITEKCICYKIEREKLQQIIKSFFKYPEVQNQNQQKKGQLNQSEGTKTSKIRLNNIAKKIAGSIGLCNKESPNTLDGKNSNKQNSLISDLTANLIFQKGEGNTTPVLTKNPNLQQLNIITHNRNHYHSKAIAILQGQFQHAEKCLQKIKNQDTHDKYRRKQTNKNKITNFPNFFSKTAHNFNQRKKIGNEANQNDLLSGKAFKIKEHFSNSLNQKYRKFAQKKIAFLINKENNMVRLSPSNKSRVESVIQPQIDAQFVNNAHSLTSQVRCNSRYTRKISQAQEDCDQICQEENQDQNFAKLVQQSSKNPILYEIKQLHPSTPEMTKINAKLKQIRLGKIQKIKENLMNSRENIIVSCNQSYQQNQNQNMQKAQGFQMQNKQRQQSYTDYPQIDNQMRNYVNKFLIKNSLRKKGAEGNVLLSYMNNSSLKRNVISKETQESFYSMTLQKIYK